RFPLNLSHRDRLGPQHHAFRNPDAVPRCMGATGFSRRSVFAAFLILSASCSSPTTPDVPGAVRVDGTVQFYSFEGGFWAIRGDDGVIYEPVDGLSSAFQRENLRVSAVLRIRHDLTGFHMAGPIVEIVSIVRL